MGFEFDPVKSESNRAKHGINFKQARAIWNDLVVTFSSQQAGEPRKLVIGKMGVTYWTAIITERGENIRIISVRKARTNEKAIYNKQIARNGGREP
jgi:uncharacterized DUF497 family protein